MGGVSLPSIGDRVQIANKKGTRFIMGGVMGGGRKAEEKDWVVAQTISLRKWFTKTGSLSRLLKYSFYIALGISKETIKSKKNRTVRTCVHVCDPYHQYLEAKLLPLLNLYKVANNTTLAI